MYNRFIAQELQFKSGQRYLLVKYTEAYKYFQLDFYKTFL